MTIRKTILATAAVLAAIGAAYGHPLPQDAAPKPNATLAQGPTEIRITFSEGLELVFSGIEVDDAQGKAVPAGAAALAPSGDRELVVPLTAKLAPGTYTVKWHAVGADTHHVSGHYTFQVKS